ncbi:hypothetical protein, partial [Bradyrhizobium sp. STM 3843]|uniref:hypothetical protein n=1 Tax=Bradyrhizobium sp. STM 3843 TaxID=551947 RepID=UPI000566DB06
MIVILAQICVMTGLTRESIIEGWTAGEAGHDENGKIRGVLKRSCVVGKPPFPPVGYSTADEACI